MIPAEASVTMEGDKILLNGHVLAIVKGDDITADQIIMDRKATTPREKLMANLNARLKALK